MKVNFGLNSQIRYLDGANRECKDFHEMSELFHFSMRGTLEIRVYDMFWNIDIRTYSQLEEVKSLFEQFDVRWEMGRLVKLLEERNAKDKIGN